MTTQQNDGGPSEESNNKKIFYSFLATLADGVFDNVVRPTFTTMIEDLVRGVLDRLLYGGNQAGYDNPSYSEYYGGYTNYTNYSRVPTIQSRVNPNKAAQIRRPNKFENLVFEYRATADSVYHQLNRIVMEYGFATVGELKSYAGLPSNRIDNNWGWTSLGPPKFRSVSGGWELILPEPHPLN